MNTCTIRPPKSSSIQSRRLCLRGAAGACRLRSRRLFDFVADGFDLRRAESGAEQKIIREGAEAFEIEQGHIRRLLFLRGLDGRAKFEAKRFLAVTGKGPSC